jgi:hypothetical protein
LELELRGDEADRHDHPEHRDERQPQVSRILFEHLALRAEQRRQVVIEQADLKQRRNHRALHLFDSRLVRLRSEYQQHPSRRQQRDDGKSDDWWQLPERKQQEIEGEGQHPVQDRHGPTKCTRALSAFS